MAKSLAETVKQHQTSALWRRVKSNTTQLGMVMEVVLPTFALPKVLRIQRIVSPLDGAQNFRENARRG